jgi:4'-phosphopantetheinyl transferase
VTRLLVVTAEPVGREALTGALGPRDETAHRPGPDRSASAHALLGVVLAELTGRAVAEHVLHRWCGACGGSHGKPVLDHPTLHVSLSSTDGLVAVAVTEGGPVGVDVERRGKACFEGFADVAVAPGETVWDPAVTWTRKEAWLKATGTGLAVDPRSIDASSPPADVQLYDVPVADDLACAVAVLSRRRQPLDVQRRKLA